VLSAYDFSPFSKIGDIGGGRGHLLQAVLEATPGATGVLFDQPHVIAESASLASKRLSLQSGDFFKDALLACDAYLVMEVIHDWNDMNPLPFSERFARQRRATPSSCSLRNSSRTIPGRIGPRRWTSSCCPFSVVRSAPVRNMRRCSKPQIFLWSELWTRAVFPFWRQCQSKRWNSKSGAMRLIQ